MPSIADAPLEAIPTDRANDLNDYRLEDENIRRQNVTNNEMTLIGYQNPLPIAGEEQSGLGIDEAVKIKKQRAPVAKLDEDRLLSKPGIPNLRQIARKRLKLRKGHEYVDVPHLLSMYQLWLDDLYPRAKFADGLAIIEKLGHSKRIQTMRREWITEGKSSQDRGGHDLMPGKIGVVDDDHLEHEVQHGASVVEVKLQKCIDPADEDPALIAETIRDSKNFHSQQQSPMLQQNSPPPIANGSLHQEQPADDLESLLLEQQKDQRWASQVRDSTFSDEMEVMREMDRNGMM